MSKWTVIRDNSIGGTKSNLNAINKMIKNTPTLSVEKMKEQSDARYAATEARKNELIAAYENKRLKSAKLIEQAQQLIAIREMKAAEAAAKAQKKE